MKTVKNIFIVWSILTFCACGNAQQRKEIDRIKENYICSLIEGNANSKRMVSLLKRYIPEEEVSDQVVVDIQSKYPLDTIRLKNYMNTFTSEGSWSDIDYADQKRSGWEPKLHTDRLLWMAKFFLSSETHYKGNKTLEASIHKALNFWYDKGLVCSNWWYNEIGVPKTMGEFFILFESYLTPKEKEKALRLMDRSQIGMTGQNRVWLAGNVLVKALLLQDYTLLKECRNTIMAEIVNDKKEGIKADWSFHQHGPMQQLGNYGMSYIMSMAFYANLFRGTSLAFTKDKLEILSNFIGHGYRWTIWRGIMDINTLTRQFFKNAPIDKSMGLGFAAAELSGCGDNRCKLMVDSLFEDNYPPQTSETSFVGYNHFWCSDYTIYRRPHWMASLRMSSERVLGTELVNEDNLKGYYWGDGAFFVYQRGDEYLNIMPFLNWRKIPGITSWDTEEEIPPMSDEANNQGRFTGGVSAGKTGLSVMTLDRDGLFARKVWIMERDFILCLGSDILSNLSKKVMTSIDQRFKRGELLYLDGKQWTAVQGKVNKRGGRYYHDHTGYIIWDAGATSTVVEKRKGEWCEFMGLYKPLALEAEIMALQLDHGRTSQPASYAYAILPYTSSKEVAQFDDRKINIIENSGKLQMVKIGSENIYIAAYEPLVTKIPGIGTFSCNQPGLYILHKQDGKLILSMSDPTQDLACMGGELIGKKYVVNWSMPEKGKTKHFYF